MLIGLISDTHDNLPMIKKAVDCFLEKNVDAVIHAGDFVAPFALKPFFRLKGRPIEGIYGNNDGEKKGLFMLFSQFGRLQEPPLKLEMDGQKILVVHDPAHLQEKDFESDLIVFGHTHEYHAIRKGKAQIINPGEAGGWLNGAGTVALYDTAAHTCEKIDLGPIS
jgi:putative phosphoesterase